MLILTKQFNFTAKLSIMRLLKVNINIKTIGVFSIDYKTFICSCTNTQMKVHLHLINHLADAFFQSDIQMRRIIAIRPSRVQQYRSVMTSVS